MQNKVSLYILLFIIVVIACSQPININKLDLNVKESETLNNWIEFYKENNPNFSLDKFKFYSMDTLKMIKGNVYGKFDKEFKPIYSNFIVFDSKNKNYIDFDSYQWSLDENSKLVFSPDQEINLINMDNQTVNRIGFRGISQWVENVFWKNNSQVILLENTRENRPIISVIDLNNRTISSFIYKNQLAPKSKYIELRFKEHGLEFK